MNPEALSFSTIFNGFKNNDYQTGTITVSGSIGAGGSGSFSTTITLQRNQSVTQLYMTTNRTSEAGLYVSGQTYYLPATITYLNGTTPTFPLDSPYTLQFFTAFTATQVTITAFIQNPYAETLSNIDATYNIQAFTFVAPFVT